MVGQGCILQPPEPGMDLGSGPLRWGAEEWSTKGEWGTYLLCAPEGPGWGRPMRLGWVHGAEQSEASSQEGKVCVRKKQKTGSQSGGISDHL